VTDDRAPFVHPAGLCESTNVGAGTTIWAYAHVLPGAVIGRDCNICDGVFIENDVVVGDRVTVKCGVQLWDGIRIGDDVFLGPNATFTNDPFPRSRQRPDRFLTTEVHDGASIGANATVLPGVVIGRRAMVGAGAVVTEDVPANAKVVGNPGRIIGYVDDRPYGAPALDGHASAGAPQPASLPAGVQVIDIPRHVDMRGSLVAAEVGGALPFEPQRYFVVFAVPSQHVRGEHAHRRCWQFLTCVAGSVLVHLDDGTSRHEVALSSPDRGVVVPPMVWASQFRYSSDAVLVVLASHAYDPADYIRDYGEFLAEVDAAR
jgi:acetyltransferase-like isoleucine patch superfamily enzyme/dTDP-4-dehydrorhamnose 3,5-epimerase-like enzyme